MFDQVDLQLPIQAYDTVATWVRVPDVARRQVRRSPSTSIPWLSELQKTTPLQNFRCEASLPGGFQISNFGGFCVTYLARLRLQRPMMGSLQKDGAFRPTPLVGTTR